MRIQKNITLWAILFVALILTASCVSTNKRDTKPNIIVVYVDDLGYGDLGCYGALGVETPNIDAMAENGMRFTDAHCPAATCTPSRYSLLTGKYAFREGAAILPGDAPMLIQPGQGTLASMLQKAGYTTGVVGKWHLGLGSGNLNWNDSIKPGPLEIGFDYSFLIPATGDRVPSVYVEDYHVVDLDAEDPITVSFAEKVGNEPTGTENPELLKVKADPQHSNTIVNGISRIGFMTGGKSALWTDEDFPDVLTLKAKQFIQRNKENPFFLYFAFHDIHVPRIAHDRFKGSSTMGPRGDVIAQMDWCTGEIVNYLEELGIAENTLIIFSSDNGPVLTDGYDDQAVELLGEHDPSGPYRGGKYSAYEAGTRVPNIVYWPGTVQPGVSDALLTHTDLFASLAALVGQELEPGEAPDSENTIDAWLGKSPKGRSEILEESFTFSLRQGDWKYIQPSSQQNTWIRDNKNIEGGLQMEPQLYDLNVDEGEQHNLADMMPEKLREMKLLLKEITE